MADVRAVLEEGQQRTGRDTAQRNIVLRALVCRTHGEIGQQVDLALKDIAAGAVGVLHAEAVLLLGTSDVEALHLLRGVAAAGEVAGHYAVKVRADEYNVFVFVALVDAALPHKLVYQLLIQPTIPDKIAIGVQIRLCPWQRAKLFMPCRRQPYRGRVGDVPVDGLQYRPYSLLKAHAMDIDEVVDGAFAALCP